VNLESVDPIKLDFKLPEKYSGHIAKGLKLVISVDAWPGRLFNGEIMAVDPRLEAATRTLRVRARLPNADLALKPGMFARISLDLGAARRGVFVPEQAVEAKGSSYSLFRIVDGKTVFTPVQLGERKPGVVEISSGVNAGDWVVVEGQLKLADGMAVTILPQAAP
jgi:membrane fusion protein (multidrug efflux system)